MRYLYWLLFSSLSLFFNTLKAQKLVEVVNTLPQERCEIVSIPLKNVPDKLFPIVSVGDRELISQLVDESGDGQPDHLFVQVDIKPLERMNLCINWSEQLPTTRVDTVVSVRLSHRSNTGDPFPMLLDAERKRGFIQDISNPVYQMEGPGIENDKVAFRSFFDYRNGKDIYGKIVPKSVLDIVGLKGSWHDLQWWGKDVLRVGTSLGAGSLAVFSNGVISNAGDADFSYYKSCNSGALYGSYLLSFQGWDGGKMKVDGSEMISMTKGTYCYKNIIKRPLDEMEKLVIGFANFGINKVRLMRHGKYMSLSSYGMQADGSDKPMGLAIMFEAEQYHSYQTNTDNLKPENSTYVLLTSKPLERTVYFFACWGATDERFNTEKGFYDYLSESALLFANPLMLKIVE